MATVLYDVPLSPFAQKVKIVLREKNIPFEAKAISLLNPPADFLAASPRREVPALIDDGNAIFDSTIILDYIEDKWPTPPMMPTDPAGRARARMIEELCDGQFEGVNFCVTEIFFFKRAEGELATKLAAAAKDSIGDIVAWLEKQLGDGPWFNGVTFGRADAAVLPHVSNAGRNGPAPGSKLADWLARAQARPSVAQTLGEAKASLGGFKDMAAKYAAGEAKRQYRDHRLAWMVQNGGISIIQAGLASGNLRCVDPLKG